MDVRKSYQMDEIEVPVLKGVSLRVRAGQSTVLVAPSGSGKTTLLNLVGCIDTCDAGRVIIAGQDVAHLSDDQLSDFRAAHVGFIFQNFNLIPVLSAFENVEYPLILADVPKPERRRRVQEMLAAVGLADRAKNLPGQLSGGQRQRVAIARALIRNPALVIADEPTANLDSRTSEEILALMWRMQREQDVAFLISSHDPTVIQASDKVVYMRDGDIERVTMKSAPGRAKQAKTAHA